MVVVLGPAIRQLDASLEEAARSCGAGPVELFRRITLPILMPAILTGMLAAFIRSLESFEVEQLLGRPARIEVYSTRIYDLMAWEPPRIAQAMTLSTLVLIALFVLTALFSMFLQRRSYATVTGRTTVSHRLDIGRARWVVGGLLLLLVAGIVYTPLFFLVLGSCMRLFGYFQIATPFTLDHWREVLNDPLFLSALRNSCILALSAGLAGTLLYSVLAYLIVRGHYLGRRTLELLCWFPWLIPGLLLGVALLTFILTFNQFGFLYGSVASLVAVIVLAQLPIGVHMMKTAVAQLSEVLEHASRVCGASPVRTFFSIVLPLVRPMMVSIFTIVFIAGMRDIGTIIFLIGAQNQTMSVLSMQFALSTNLEAAAVVGVITTAIVVVAALVARRMGLQIGRQGT
jgi:iron(III) transport system permease protein